MRVVSRLVMALGAGSVLLGAGCVSSRAEDRGARLEASPHPYESDVPLPVGFRLVESASEDWSSGEIRYLRHRYCGRADKIAVRRFYREQMAVARWTAISDGQVHGRYTLRFERKRESCTLILDDSGQLLPGGVTIDVLITPLR